MAAPTFGSIKTKISRKLIDAAQTAISDSGVGDALNDALRYWKQKRFWFNEGQGFLTMDVNDPYILGPGNSAPAGYPGAPSLPADFLYEFEKDGFVISYSKLFYRFRKVPPGEFDSANIQGQGIPYIYCFRNGNYEFYYYPNLAYSMTVNYLKDVADMVNAADTNIFTANADRLIMYEALAHLLGEDRQDDKSESNFFAKVDREYKLLKARSARGIASGHLSVSSILD